jgi:hypothetical protein
MPPVAIVLQPTRDELKECRSAKDVHVQESVDVHIGTGGVDANGQKAHAWKCSAASWNKYESHLRVARQLHDGDILLVSSRQYNLMTA